MYRAETVFYTTFTVIFRLRCNILSMETNGLDHAVRGGKCIRRSIIYSLPTHAHISPAGSPSFAVNLQQFTPPLYTLYTAQMVLLWFIWQSAPSQAHAEL